MASAYDDPRKALMELLTEFMPNEILCGHSEDVIQDWLDRTVDLLLISTPHVHKNSAPIDCPYKEALGKLIADG